MDINAFIEFSKNVGIWAALFICLLVYVFKQNKDREDILRKDNNDRELRYISTIDNITEKVYNKIENIGHKVDIIEEKISEKKG